MNIHDEMDEVYQALVDSSRVIDELFEMISNITGKSLADIEISGQFDVSSVMVQNDRVCEKIEAMTVTMVDPRGSVDIGESDGDYAHSISTNDGWEYYG